LTTAACKGVFASIYDGRSVLDLAARPLFWRRHCRGRRTSPPIRAEDQATTAAQSFTYANAKALGDNGFVLEDLVVRYRPAPLRR
jgi:hypothetical protein